MRLVRSAPPGYSVSELPSMEEVFGYRRFKVLVDCLGLQQAKEAIAEAGLYLLDDSLCHRLRLEGVEVSDGGEFACLSPSRWPEEIADICLDEAMLILGEGEFREWTSFESKNPMSGDLSKSDYVWAIRTFFFQKRLRVALPQV